MSPERSPHFGSGGDAELAGGVHAGSSDDDAAAWSTTTAARASPVPPARTFRGAPLWAWAQIAASVFAVSTAGVAFRRLPDVPPTLLASWRLQATSGVLAACLARRDLPAASPNLLSRWRASARQLITSGVFLGAHFALWVIGLQNTSLPRSLLLVCSTPLIISLGALACGFPVSLGELAGSALGVAGAALLAADPSRDASASVGPAPSWAGDVVSFGAAAAIVPYMLVGRESRKWMPLFMYACPVTLVAAIVTAAASLATESVWVFASAEGHEGEAGGEGDAHARRALFGWLLDPDAFVVVAYLALVPGMVGHTGYNAALRYVPPLVVSVSLTFEPLFGSLLGWAMGVADAPGWGTTWGGATLVLAVAAVVVSADARRETDAEPNRARGDGESDDRMMRSNA